MATICDHWTLRQNQRVLAGKLLALLRASLLAARPEDQPIP